MTRAQITVRGAGIFGLSIAWEAVQRGAKVRVIDTQGIGAGSSGGIVGAMNPHVPETWEPKKAFQLDSLLMAGDFWAKAESASGMQAGYARAGRLQPIVDDAGLALARLRVETAQHLWQGRAEWQVRPATGAAWEPASPTGFLVYDTLSARLHPRMAAATLCAAIVALGGEVIVGDAENQGAVIWATGMAGLAALGADLGRPIGGGEKGQAALLNYDVRGMPQIFANWVHFVPHANGTVAIGSTSERAWQDANTTDQRLETLIANARAAMPVLANAKVLERWAGIRPRASSRAPILGAWPNRAGHFVANGGFKIGFGMAPKVAQVIVDLVLDGRDTIPTEFAL
jgi:glycine oxidase